MDRQRNLSIKIGIELEGDEKVRAIAALKQAEKKAIAAKEKEKVENVIHKVENVVENVKENVVEKVVDKVKKGSYPSRQQRFGAAPLASFEDLPSDDQCSPEEEHARYQDLSPEGSTIDKALEFDSSQLLVCQDGSNTPTSLAPCMLSRKHRGSDTASNSTLKGDTDNSVTPVATPDAAQGSGSFSSLTNQSQLQLKPASVSFLGRGSHGSLLAPPSQSPTSLEPKRKGSWTDIFFPARARSKSHSGVSSPNRKSSPIDDASAARKRKSSIFKLFNFGKKSPTKENKETSQRHDRTPHVQPGIEISDTPRVSVTDTSEDQPREELMIGTPLDDPVESEQDIKEIIEAAKLQMQRTPNENSPGNEILPLNDLPLPNLRKKLRRQGDSTIDDDIQSEPEILPSSRSKERNLDLLCSANSGVSNGKNMNTVIAQIEHVPDRDRDRDTSDISESDFGGDETSISEARTTKLKLKKKIVHEGEDDFEAQTLLTQESVDLDHDEQTTCSELNSINMNNESSGVAALEQIKSPTRKDRERLELNVIPIDRPRSTTPINAASLDQYIRSSSISGESNVGEKIKLSLPGEQFTASARAKSPRKSNPSIWLDFCEKGLESALQSPRSRKKQSQTAFTFNENENNEQNIENNNEKRNDNKLTELQQLTLIAASVTSSNTNTSNTDAFTLTSPGNLTPVTPLEEGFIGDSKWPGFGDNFVDFSEKDNLFSFSNGQDKTFVCNCDCNKKLESDSTNTAANNPNGVKDAEQCDLEGGKDSKLHASESQTDADASHSVGTTPDEDNSERNILVGSEIGESDEQPLVSTCSCPCHRKSDYALSYWKNTSLHKQDSVSSDISSASSRLIGSSSSKCSPNDEIAELIS